MLPALLGLVLLRAEPGLAAETLIREFDAGFGPGSVGVVDSGEDTEIAGPQAIFAGDQGEIYLLDQVNGRVLGFDAKAPAELTRSLALPEGVEATDLVVAQGQIYVWDGKPIALEASGGKLTRSLSTPPDEVTQSMFAQMGSELVPEPGDTTRAVKPPRSGSENRQLVATRGMGRVEITVSRDKEGTAATLDVRRRGVAAPVAKLKLAVSDKLGSVEFLEVDTEGRMYVLVENIPTVTIEGAVTFIARFSRRGVLEGIHELPLTPDVALSRRFVTVSPDGDVYFLRTRKGVVSVIGVGFRPMPNTNVIDLRGPAPSFADALKGEKGAIAAVRPLTRQRVQETAYAFEAVTWRVTPSAYGSDPDTRCDGFNRIRRPGYLIGRAGQTVRGIPYCWGCHGSLAQIATRIERGMLAGNVCTRNMPRRDTTGVDCSAFVSATWGLSTHFTTAAIPSIASPIANPWDLKPGDALNKPRAHVMLFLRFTPDRKVEVMEASPGACNGRVCRNVYPLASLLARGYEPRRFRALVD